MNEDIPAEPFILAIESSTGVASVGLFQGARLLGNINYHKERMHAQYLAPMIARLLQDLEVKAEELQAVLVSKGPGSYTGLRVGVSTAKGLCMALEIPLISMSSLEMLAWQVISFAKKQDALICPMIDARRMEVYTAVYDQELREIYPVSAHILTPDSFKDMLDSQSLIFVGDGVPKAIPLLAQYPKAICLTEVRASVHSIGKAVLEKFRQEEFEHLTRFEPFYLKDFVATKARKLFK